MFLAKANDNYFDAPWALECQDCLVEQMGALQTSKVTMSATRMDSTPASQKSLGLKLNLSILGISESHASEDAESAELELKCYLAAPVADVGIDPLMWWHTNQNLYPCCALMARKILATPGK